ncbi:MAG: integration host factor [Tomitella sp.]|nr:integration host factor [Tomitella sp.]
MAGLPTLTPEQRAASLEKAAFVRKQRAEIKEKLKAGSLTAVDALDRSANDEVLGKMKVSAMLKSLPGYGASKTQALMDEIGISDSRRLRGLGTVQRGQLRTRLTD